jgi:hypothetical protein
MYKRSGRQGAPPAPRPKKEEGRYRRGGKNPVRGEQGQEASVVTNNAEIKSVIELSIGARFAQVEAHFGHWIRLFSGGPNQSSDRANHDKCPT